MSDVALGICLSGVYLLIAVVFAVHMVCLLQEGDKELTEEDVVFAFRCGAAWPITLPLWLWKNR